MRGKRYPNRGRALAERAMLGAVLCLIASSASAAPSGVPACRLRLQVWLSGDVPDPRDPGFLSSLANQPGYVLRWVTASSDDMSVTLELTGPGPDYLCREEVEKVRRDGRVLELRVLSSSGGSRG